MKPTHRFLRLRTQRRHWIRLLAVCVFGSPLGLLALGASRIRIGWLSTAPHPLIKDFRLGLQELGYGGEVFIDERYGDGSQLSGLALELLRARPQVIVTSGSLAGVAAKEATTLVPIVAVTGDPVAAGLVANLAHPGGNVTGLSMMTGDIFIKWVQLLLELLPGLSRVAILGDGTAASRDQAARAQAAAPSLGIDLVHVEVRNATEIGPVVAAVKDRVAAVILLPSPFFASQAARIVGVVNKTRLPAMYEHGLFVENGGLISYGPDLHHIFRRAAIYVDRILKGAAPSSLPVEQPTRLELTVNARTAATQGIRVPQSLLLRADVVLR